MTAPTHEGPGWIEIAVETDPVAHEAMSAFLFELGCAGLVSDDRNDRLLKAYLPAHRNPEILRGQIGVFLQKLEGIFPRLGPQAFTLNLVKDENWGVTWRRFFRRERISSQLTVVPEWEPVPDTVNGFCIRMDPGPAFGTGKHSTTRMCLLAMERTGLEKPWDMLDVGTGSGILAIYGAKLGAAGVLAVDLDPEALRWAERNIELNGASDVIELSDRPVEDLKGPFSIIAANLTLNEILRLLSHFGRLLNDRGRLILSGILTDQAPNLGARMGAYGLNKVETACEDEWACVTATKTADP